MFIIWGFGRKTVKDYGTTEHTQCSHCNNTVNPQLVKVTTWFSVFFIPIIPYNTEYCIVCPVCNNTIRLPKDEFMNLAEGREPVSTSNETTASPANKYSGKTETQINYLNQMEELRKEKEQRENSNSTEA